MVELKLPELGESIETAEVSQVLVKEGDNVQAGQSVMELESEKASFPLPCPTAGRVGKIHVKAGDSVSVGQTVLTIDEAEAKTSGNGKPKPKEEKKPEPAKTEEKKEPAKTEDKKEPAKQEPAKAEEPKEEPPPREEAHAEKPKATDGKPAKAETTTKTRVAAGPATRRLARELGVNLGDVAGSERGGRITRADVKAFVKQRLTTRPFSDGAPPLPDFSRFGSVKRAPLNKIARAAAQRLSIAWRTAPHVTQHDLVDVTELEAARRRFNENRKDVKITMTALAIEASVVALRAFPKFNSSLDGEELVVKEYYHVGIAVDTEHGLLVPVVRDADKKSLVELAHELSELAEKARQRSLTPKDMEGGTFTITNLGGIGGGFFTPIINWPEVAILGLGRASTSAERLLLPLSLSYDHRVINGADGARFVRKLGELLGDPFALLAEA